MHAHCLIKLLVLPPFPLRSKPCLRCLLLGRKSALHRFLAAPHSRALPIAPPPWSSWGNPLLTFAESYIPVFRTINSINRPANEPPRLAAHHSRPSQAILCPPASSVERDTRHAAADLVSTTSDQGRRGVTDRAPDPYRVVSWRSPYLVPRGVPGGLPGGLPGGFATRRAASPLSEHRADGSRRPLAKSATATRARGPTPGVTPQKERGSRQAGFGFLKK